MSDAGRIEGILAVSAVQAARRLIGATLTLDGIGGTIVETEAYDQSDPASHTYCGQTPRNAVMFGEAGRLYVYRSYGLHWCLNITCGRVGHGAAVLIRALEPTAGLEEMMVRRGTDDPRQLCAGPGRLCQALSVTREHNGLCVATPPFSLTLPARRQAIVVGRRIGISKAPEAPWRFGLRGSPFVSRPFAVVPERTPRRAPG